MESQRLKAETYVQNQKDHHQQQTLNNWLEWCTEFDEGPNDIGLEPDTVPPIIREEAVNYSVWGEAPF